MPCSTPNIKKYCNKILSKNTNHFMCNVFFISTTVILNFFFNMLNYIFHGYSNYKFFTLSLLWEFKQSSSKILILPISGFLNTFTPSSNSIIYYSAQFLMIIFQSLINRIKYIKNSEIFFLKNLEKKNCSHWRRVWVSRSVFLYYFFLKGERAG